MQEPELKNDEPAALLVGFVTVASLGLCAWLALVGRADMLLYGDEYLSIQNLGLGFSEALGHYDDRGTGVGFLLLQKLSVALLGPGPWAYRLPATLGALGALCMVYPVGRRLVGGWAALLATPLLACTSMFVYYARFGRTYSILVCLMLVYVWALERLRRPSPSAGDRRLSLLLVSLAGGLLPWFHLTSASSVAFLGLVGLLQLRGRRAELRSLALALVAGAGLCLLLMLPARESMLTFYGDKMGGGKALEAGAIEVGSLLWGTPTAALLCMGLGVLGLAFFWWRRPAGWALLLGAVLMPLFSVLISRPSGAIYAFSRYQITALPFLLMLIAWALMRLGELLPRGGRALGLGLGFSLATTLCLGGPGLRDPAAFGPFAASNLSLRSLPAFDAPWKGMSPFYARLAQLDAELRVLELPEQISRSALLYRNHWLTHRKDVSMGFMITHKAERIPAGPHVNLRAGELEHADVDYVIYHKRIQEELTQYWIFVHAKAWDLEKDGELMPFMQGHGNFGKRFEGRKIALGALASLGDPFYEDHYIRVWKMK